MILSVLKSKIHRARVTAADLHYEGSCSIDLDLIEAAHLFTHEHIHVWNVTRGSRLETYVIPAPRGSGIIQMNGAAAHHTKKGDLIIITSFGYLPEKQIKKFKPHIVFLDGHNKIKRMARKSGHKA